ncbi:MAG: orotidine 5'-phosphate decarboxylase / HUMPS family protein [Acidimicrobiia bacterium]
MNRLVVSLDVPTATEARRVARAVGEAGVGVRIGPRLLNRVGPAVIATVRSEAEVLADARIGGSPTEVVAAARALASLGASWVTVDGAIGPGAIAAAVDVVATYGAALLATTVPPEAPDPPGGRGKAVSGLAQILAASRIAAVLGLAGDVGVVVQVAPGLPVVVYEAVSVPEVADALSKGALAVVVDAGIARAADPAAAVAPYVEVTRAA